MRNITTPTPPDYDSEALEHIVDIQHRLDILKKQIEGGSHLRSVVTECLGLQFEATSLSQLLLKAYRERLDKS